MTAWEDILAAIEEIENTKPILACRPEDAPRIRRLAAAADIPVRVKPSPLVPEGSAYVVSGTVRRKVPRP